MWREGERNTAPLGGGYGVFCVFVRERVVCMKLKLNTRRVVYSLMVENLRLKHIVGESFINLNE